MMWMTKNNSMAGHDRLAGSARIHLSGVLRAALLCPLLVLGGCMNDIETLTAPPELSAIGDNLGLEQVNYRLASAPPRGGRQFQSLWTSRRSNFFSDQRAQKVGDVLTVQIAISDRASLDSQSTRNRNAQSASGFGLNYQFGSGAEVEADADISVTASSSTAGRGGVNRSENITMRIAAVVTRVLPNNNLVISGSQEVRVNYEMRVVNVVGIVRPQDIGPQNTVDYDKIAEARISYGGRGIVNDVQRPGIAQRVYDEYSPY